MVGRSHRTNSKVDEVANTQNKKKTAPKPLTPSVVLDTLAPVFDRLRSENYLDQIIAGKEILDGLLDAQAVVAAIRRSAVRELRAQGFTLAELAEMTGLTNQRIASIEKGVDRRAWRSKRGT